MLTFILPYMVEILYKHLDIFVAIQTTFTHYNQFEYK